MNITLYGAGYVGLVSAVCFAERGHFVCCVDVDADKVAQLNQGRTPIYEMQLETLLKNNLASKRVFFTTDFQQAIDHAALQMIAVGTPSKPDGQADLQYVVAVAENIGRLMSSYCCIVNKSTVPVGTAEMVQQIVSKQLQQRKKMIAFDVVSNPEFLREGCAIADCLSPDRIIVGLDSERALNHMRDLYQPWIAKNHVFLSMDTASAELTKYAANALLATKVSFMNEMSQIAERVGANIHAIKQGLSLDSRINAKFLNAGCGFGGSCFPKDISALVHTAIDHGYQPHILQAVLKTNTQQQQLLFHKINRYFKEDLTNKTIALWGLAFKPDTDDIRCASSCVLMEMLFRAGAKVQAYDPLAMHNVRRAYASEKRLVLCEDQIQAVKHADVLAVVTEWDDFKNPDFLVLKNTLKNPAIFDGRNLYDRDTVLKAGLDYFGIGC